NIFKRQLSLSPARRAILEKWKHGESVETADAQGIPRRLDQGPVPLSFAQQRLWFLDQLEPGSTAYNIPVAVRLSGKLDAIALERGLRELVRRHEALRTTFADMDCQPVQVIAPAAAFQGCFLSTIDLRALSDEGRETEVRRLTQQEGSQPFDLAHGLLLRT